MGQPGEQDSRYQGKLPPEVLDALTRVNLVDNKAKLMHFVKAAGKEPKDLPKIRNEKACFHHLMGNCRALGCTNKHFIAPSPIQGAGGMESDHGDGGEQDLCRWQVAKSSKAKSDRLRLFASASAEAAVEHAQRKVRWKPNLT